MQGTLKTCRLCKVEMKTSPFAMCDTCLTDSNRIQNYIIKHPHVSIEQISLAADVPHEKVTNMVKLGIGYGENG